MGQEEAQRYLYYGNNNQSGTGIDFEISVYLLYQIILQQKACFTEQLRSKGIKGVEVLTVYDILGEGLYLVINNYIDNIFEFIFYRA